MFQGSDRVGHKFQHCHRQERGGLVLQGPPRSVQSVGGEGPGVRGGGLDRVRGRPGRHGQDRGGAGHAANGINDFDHSPVPSALHFPIQVCCMAKLNGLTVWATF